MKYFTYFLDNHSYILFIILSLILLFIAESLGKLMKQYVDEYQPISALFQFDNSTGFNAIYRICLTPIFTVLVSVLLYLLKLDHLVGNIWTVSIIYFLLQTLILICLQRWSLINRSKYLIFHLISILLSLYIYYSVIIHGLDSILPEGTALRTELWLIIAAFIYGIFKAVPENINKFNHRKDNYIYKMEKALRSKYKISLGKYSVEMKKILLAIMIYENYNRPPIVRLVERLKGPSTRFVMQVYGANSDEESIKMTENELTAAFHEFKVSKFTQEWERMNALSSMFALHNPNDPTYAQRVVEIYQKIQ